MWPLPPTVRPSASASPEPPAKRICLPVALHDESGIHLPLFLASLYSQFLFLTAHSTDGFAGSKARPLTSRPSGPVDVVNAQALSAIVTSRPPGHARVPVGLEPVPLAASGVQPLVSDPPPPSKCPLSSPPPPSPLPEQEFALPSVAVVAVRNQPV